MPTPTWISVAPTGPTSGAGLVELIGRGSLWAAVAIGAAVLSRGIGMAIKAIVVGP